MPPSPKTAVVTGAGSGIGRAVAAALAQNGYRVVLAGRRAETLSATVSTIGVAKEQTHVVECDVSDEKSVQNLFARTMEISSRLDVLFNNAGTSAPRIPMDELSLSDWKRVVDTNLTGTFLCTREAVRIMKHQDPCGGRIINNGSISAHSPRPHSAAYTATKHALTGLTKSTALDGRKYNIVCSQIDVGNAETPLTERMHKGVPQANGDVLIEPTFDVQHVAQAVLFMADLPLDTNVLSLTIMATTMPFVGRG